MPATAIQPPGADLAIRHEMVCAHVESEHEVKQFQLIADRTMNTGAPRVINVKSIPSAILKNELRLHHHAVSLCSPP
jgi:hypothetical protein